MGVFATYWRRVEALFPERQLLVRANGDIQCVTLSRNLQMGLSLAGIGLTLCLLVFAYQVINHHRIVAGRDARIATLAEDYSRLSADMQLVQQRYESITDDLENKHRYLREILAMRAGLERTLDEVNDELRQTENERDKARAKGQQLERQVSSLGSQLDMALATADRLERNLARLGSELSESSSARLETDERNQELAENLDALQNRLRDVELANADLTRSLADSGQQVSDLSSERRTIMARNTQLRARVDQLEGRLVMLESSQRQLVERIRDRTNDSIEDLEAAVSLTGLDLDDLLNRVQDSAAAAAGAEKGLGGPFVAVSSIDEAGEFHSSVTDLEGRLDRWTALNDVLGVLPIAAPMEQYRLTSGFGARRDPFTKRRAFHSGLDFAGPWHAPVFTTAPGVVSYAGRNGAYGRTVEVDHGHGIKTRYGHLHKLTVKKGDRVQFRDQIGQMGNTGRSTGAHLHYEILYDGKPVDPKRFLKAGKYVFKNQG